MKQEFQNKTTQTITARVTSVHRDRYSVSGEFGEGCARLKTAAYRNTQVSDIPTVGDYVELLYNAQGDSLIIKTRPRSALFTRKAPGKVMGGQAVAANFDEVFILASLNRDFNPRRIERYAALAWQSGGMPVVVLTKRDLMGDIACEMESAKLAAPGTPVYAVSAYTGEGLEALTERLSPGRTVALLGSSGVGKSSLLNALAGETLAMVGEIRHEDARGRHTTTRRELLTLPCGAHIIDTPGMRELGLWDAEEGIRDAFDDIVELSLSCRFGDCTHQHEPGCAVREAVRQGMMEEARLENWRKLRQESVRREKPRIH